MMTLREALERRGWVACAVRHVGLLVLAWLFSALSVHAQSIHPLTRIMQGHQVGGVTVDAVGNLYVADFGDIVWKIPPEGQLQVFVQGLYGSSGNAIDPHGISTNSTTMRTKAARGERSSGRST